MILRFLVWELIKKFNKGRKMTMKEREEKTAEKIDFLVRVTDGVMWWIGSIPSLIVHSLVFLLAFLLPVLDVVEFNEMLLVLTTVLSLEAIYLAIFIQMS